MTQDTGPREAQGDEPTPEPAPDAGPDGAADVSLEGLDDLPLTEHVARFSAVHDALRDRLDNPVREGTDASPGADD
ncbi:hypothetical protein [Isoptericola cucumis]|uniref:Uncharacterized protein n=1 Tax=Isoptericola cucumis TaxID=1776856 RepID=A0ABQ2B2W0_9MICO|nr:hypothetical protein [Isoptericola cucumis]GGI06672.1 hypothetical protein GCM10007368_12330 [Isoptericola cucumis]